MMAICNTAAAPERLRSLQGVEDRITGGVIHEDPRAAERELAARVERARAERDRRDEQREADFKKAAAAGRLVDEQRRARAQRLLEWIACEYGVPIERLDRPGSTLKPMIYALSGEISHLMRQFS